MPEHPYGWLSLAPPLVTVVLAIVTKRAILSLLAGLFVGAMITAGGNFLQAVYDLGEVHLWATFIQPDKLRVLGFTLLMGAMIGVVNASGGMQGLVRLIEPLAKTRRRGQLTTWLLGLLVFFDDYTNTLLVGNSMRATCDRLKISREKLAFLVDSTAAPVAGLALLSTWVAVEIVFIQEGLDNCSLSAAKELSPVDLFLNCLPYRFYIIQALLFVPLVALLGRDFGPMLHAERRRLGEDAEVAVNDSASENKTTHWTNAVVPLLATLAIVLVLIITTGRAGAAIDNVVPIDTNWQDIFGAADTTLALMYGALAGLGIAAAMAYARCGISTEAINNAAYAGARTVFAALLILWFASGISRMTGNRDVDGNVTTTAYEYQDHRLYTGDFLQSLLPKVETNADGTGGKVSPTMAAALPTVVFLLASLVSFSTGTSFGTMGILLPVVMPVALASLGGDGGIDPNNPLLLATVGAVLAGAIFGDHCSPISDTTILSSQSSGCDHMAHVVTQMPYALVVAGVSTLLGTVLVAFGVSVWLLLPLQTAALVGILYGFGKKAEA